MAALLSLTLMAMAASPAAAQSANALRAPFTEAAGPSKSDNAKVAGDNERRLPPNVAPSEAARRARHEFGGRVLNVVLEDGPGGPYYRVKLLKSGRVRVVHVEARR